MAYTELTVLPYVISRASDGSSVTIGDNTVYAADGEGTATFPSYADTQRWIVYRKAPWIADTILYYPATQVGGAPPWEFTIPLLDEDGLPLEDNAYQIFLLVVAEALDWEDFFDYGPVDDIVQFALDDYAAGTLAVPMLTECTNGVNEARRRMVNAQLITGSCDTDEFDLKNAMQQGIISTLALFPNYQMLSDEETALYVEAQLQIDNL